MISQDVLSSTVDMQNAIIFSAGCHSGYNIVNADAVPQVTREPDWAQTFARKGATLIAGTGYQYGDTDFVEYSERLYLEFAKHLRYGTGSGVDRQSPGRRQADLSGEHPAHARDP